MSKVVTADIVLNNKYGSIYKFIIFINCSAKPAAILNNVAKGKGLVSMKAMAKLSFISVKPDFLFLCLYVMSEQNAFSNTLVGRKPLCHRLLTTFVLK